MTRLEAGWEHRASTNDQLETRYKQYGEKHVFELREYLADNVQGRISRPMLNKMVLDNLDYMAMNSDDMTVFRYAEELLTAFNSLQPTRFADKKVSKPPTYTGLVSEFSETYGDRHGLVAHYSDQLRAYMDSWSNSRSMWNAPYTSLINSSMTGKSRFQKQLALHDPVIYFCLRKGRDRNHNPVIGYPISTVRWVRRFIADPYRLKARYATVPMSPEEHTSLEENAVKGHLYFFATVLKYLLELVRSRTWKDKVKRDKREAL
jgi:hypothetical protein